MVYHLVMMGKSESGSHMEGGGRSFATSDVVSGRSG